MRKSFLLGCSLLLSGGLLAQAPADTTLQIEAIEVHGARFAGLSSRLGHTMLHVDQNVSSVAHTTAEALRQLPSVITDIEGSVSYRGSSRVGMRINQVPYGLLEEYSGDMLIQLPAFFFSQLSLGSFPAIGLVPDGEAGVIDLLPRLYGRSDAPLTLQLGAGWHERYNSGLALNLHPGKFHVTAKYNYRKEYRARTFSKMTRNAKNKTQMQNNASARPDVHVADLRIDYDLSPKDLLSAYGLFQHMDYSRYGRINNQVFNLEGKQMKYVIRNRYNDQRQQAYAVEAGWLHRFSGNQRLRIRFNYNNYAYDEDNEFKNEHPQNGQILAEDNQYIDQEKRNYFWSLGYEHSMDNGSFQLGYIGRAREELYDARAATRKGEAFVLDPTKTYDYRFTRTLHLWYAEACKRWRAWEAELGLQAELDHSNRFHLYPRLLVAYEFTRDHRLRLGYQQRVIRPTGAYLSPFLDRSDVTHIVQGNPDLRDEFVHLLEVGYQFSASRFRLTPSLYYRNRTNRIMEVATQAGEETIWRRENMGHSQTFGADLSGSWQPLRLLTVGFSGGLYRDEIDGRQIGYGEKKSLLCWDVKGNLNLRVTPATELQLDGFYVSDQLTPQGKIEGRYCVNAGVSHYFLQRKLCANLSVNNLFDSLEETTVIDTPQLHMIQKRNRDARVAWLTLTYRL